MLLFQQHDDDVLRQCGDWFTDDFEFVCAGVDQNPLSGTFVGVAGFQAWLDRYFKIFVRSKDHELSFQFLVEDDRVLVHYDEIVSASGLTSPVIWVNLHFQFRDGQIRELRNEHDTETGAVFLQQVFAANDR